MRIIETNLSVNSDDVIIDHQSRVIEVDTWEDYVDEIKNAETVIRDSLYGSLNGNSVPRSSTIENFMCDEFHLSCDIYNYSGVKSKKLAYRID